MKNLIFGSKKGPVKLNAPYIIPLKKNDHFAEVTALQVVEDDPSKIGKVYKRTVLI